MLYSDECKEGGNTQQMIQHMQKFHPELLPIQPDRKSATIISQTSLQEKWSVLKCLQFTKKMNF